MVPVGDWLSFRAACGRRVFHLRRAGRMRRIDLTSDATSSVYNWHERIFSVAAASGAISGRHFSRR